MERITSQRPRGASFRLKAFSQCGNVSKCVSMLALAGLITTRLYSQPARDTGRPLPAKLLHACVWPISLHTGAQRTGPSSAQAACTRVGHRWKKKKKPCELRLRSRGLGNDELPGGSARRACSHPEGIETQLSACGVIGAPADVSLGEAVGGWMPFPLPCKIRGAVVSAHDLGERALCLAQLPRFLKCRTSQDL